MSFVDNVIAAWRRLPVPVSSAIASVATFVGGAAIKYLTNSPTEILSWSGLGTALLAGLANWADSYVRLNQLPPEK